jgi:hypothetical protein
VEAVAQPAETQAEVLFLVEQAALVSSSFRQTIQPHTTSIDLYQSDLLTEVTK